MTLSKRIAVTVWIVGLLLRPQPVSATELSRQDTQELPVLRLSLRDAMEASVGNNPNVKYFKERIAAARAVTRTQLGALLPNLSSNVRQSNQTLFLGTLGLAPIRTDPFSIFDVRANVTQSLFSLSLIQRWRASREALHVAEFESDISKFDTMAGAGLIYMEALKAGAQIETRKANIKLLSELLDQARDREKKGLATGLDTARLAAQLEHERQQLSVAQYDFERLKLNLIHTLGISFDVQVVLTDDFRLEMPDVPALQDALSTAFTNRVEVKAQNQRIKTASLTLNSTVTERLPSLVGQGDYGLIGNRWNNTLDTYNVALLLAVPIFDGGQREGRISESRSLVQQEMFRLQTVVNKVNLEVREALVTLTSSRDQVVIAQSGLQAAASELELARERFTILTRTSNLEVTNAIYALARARDNIVDATFRLNAARVNLARAVGRLDELR
jgi:outer membrane protein TolC